MTDAELVALARVRAYSLVCEGGALLDRMSVLEKQRDGGWAGVEPMGPMAYTSYMSDSWNRVCRYVEESSQLWSASDELASSESGSESKDSAREFLECTFGEDA